VLEKPNGHEPEDQWERHFIATLKLVSRIRVITHLRAKLNGVTQPVPHRPCSTRSLHRGPAADRDRRIDRWTGRNRRGVARPVAQVQAPVLLVLHINEPFGTAFADWLDAQTPRRVAYARDGEPVAALAGRVAIAPPTTTCCCATAGCT